MSKKVYANVGTFSPNRPIPVLEPEVKTGNGKATFKTATAEANAAREARDEARALTNECASLLLKTAKAKETARLYCESMHRTYRRDFWWKLLILGSVLIEILVRLTT